MLPTGAGNRAPTPPSQKPPAVPTHGDPDMLLALTLVASLHAAPAASISGKGQLKGDVVGNPLNTICEIAQSGTKISGVCTNDQGGPAQPITGEVKGDSVIFEHGGD